MNLEMAFTPGIYLDAQPSSCSVSYPALTAWKDFMDVHEVESARDRATATMSTAQRFIENTPIPSGLIQCNLDRVELIYFII